MLRCLMPSPNMSRPHNVLIDEHFFLSSYVILFLEAQPGYQVVKPPPAGSLNSDIEDHIVSKLASKQCLQYRSTTKFVDVSLEVHSETP
jgi:hypothetical protein